MFNNFDHYNYDFPRIRSYKEAERLYESITPLKGATRGHMNLRPVGRRRSGGNSYITKQDDGSYRVHYTYNFSPYRVRHNLGDTANSSVAVDFHRDKIVVQTGQWLCIESTALLASMVDLVRINSKLYIRTNRGVFFVPTKTELILRKRHDGWQVANPVRETHDTISPPARKKITKELKDWFSWAQKMWPFVDIPTVTGWRQSYWSGWAADGLSKDLTTLADGKKNSAKTRYDYNTRQYVHTPATFASFKKQAGRQARKTAYRNSPHKKTVTVPLGKPAPRPSW